MRKFILLIIAIIFSTSFFTSCLFLEPSVRGNGNVVEEVRDVDNFTRLKTSRGVNVYISQGSNEKVLIKTDENLIDVIETKVEKGTLTITTNKQIKEATTNKVFVTVSDLEKVSAFAGSNVYSETEINVDFLDLSSSAGSNLKMEVKAHNMEVSASAGSNIFLEGTTKNIKLTASAGSNIKAEDLTSKNCRAKASSGANIYITVEDELEGKASSGGNIIYSGNPEHFNTSNSSGGNVIKR